MAAIGASLLAVICAAALLAGLLGVPARPGKSGPGHKAPVVLTAAMLRHMASASRLALAHSGRAVVTSREILGGALQQTGTDDITFSGGNWNDSFTVVTPAGEGQPASAESAINRVVNGRAYDYFVAADGLAWYHDTGPNAVENMSIPDPRKLLIELAAAARFVQAGRTVLGGVPVTELTATNLSGLPALNSPSIWPAGTITALSVWVDGNGVVRQLTASGTQTVRVGGFLDNPATQRLFRLLLAAVQRLVKQKHLTPAQALERGKFSALGRRLRQQGVGFVRSEPDSMTMTIRFLDIGQPQVIRPPAHAIPTRGLG